MTKNLKPKPTTSEKITNWVGTPFSICVHTVAFLGIYSLYFYGLGFDEINLILTTVVSLEAIYLALLIQMSVNRQAQSLQDVQEDIEEISEDVEEIAEDVEGLEKNVDEIQEDVEDLGQDMDKISKEVVEMNEDDEVTMSSTQQKTLENIELTLKHIINEIDAIKQNVAGQTKHKQPEAAQDKKPRWKIF